METQELNLEQGSIHGGLGSQIRTLGRFLRGKLDYGAKNKQESEKALDSISKIEDVSERQIRLTKIITESLRRKGVLATNRESIDHFQREFGLAGSSGYNPPEAFLRLPGGGTFFDEESGGIKVYINPELEMFEPDYQLMTVLEEAIHWSQLHQSGRRTMTWQDEIEAKKKLLRIADYLGFDDDRKEFLERSRDYVIARSKDIQNSVKE